MIFAVGAITHFKVISRLMSQQYWTRWEESHIFTIEHRKFMTYQLATTCRIPISTNFLGILTGVEERTPKLLWMSCLSNFITQLKKELCCNISINQTIQVMDIMAHNALVCRWLFLSVSVKRYFLTQRHLYQPTGLPANSYIILSEVSTEHRVRTLMQRALQFSSALLPLSSWFCVPLSCPEMPKCHWYGSSFRTTKQWWHSWLQNWMCICLAKWKLKNSWWFTYLYYICDGVHILLQRGFPNRQFDCKKKSTDFACTITIVVSEASNVCFYSFTLRDSAAENQPKT